MVLHYCSSCPASEKLERVRALRHSSGGRGLTGETTVREDSHTRSVRWPASVACFSTKEQISLLTRVITSL